MSTSGHLLDKPALSSLHYNIEYIDKAMGKATHEKLEDGTFSGRIPRCPGVVAFGKTLFQCHEELRSSLEGCLIVKIRHGDKLPVVDGINLNKMMPTVQENVLKIHAVCCSASNGFKSKFVKPIGVRR